MPNYNCARHLEALASDSQAVVGRVAYDARGERVLAVYGNGLMTRLAYHAQTRHLARIRTERYTPGLASPGGVSYVPAGGVVQDSGYVYDLGGRVTAIRERAPGTGVGTAPNALNRAFQYDAIGRLTRATGREAAEGPPSPPWALSTPRGALLPDPSLLRSYLRRYDYDAVSALTRTRHSSPTDASAAFTRTFVTAVHGTGVNAGLRRDRLARIEVGSGGLTGHDDYTYDAAGQLTREGSARHVAWGASGKVRSFRVQVEQPDGTAALPSVYARYLYDGSGARVRKVTRQQDGGGLSVTTLGAVEREEERSPFQSTPRVETTTRLGEGIEVRAGTASSSDGRPAWRQTLSDRSGSGVAVVGGSTLAGAYVLISREEYYPYGETSVGGAAKASVRFDGKGRDAESGYQDYGLRTYASWTGRFISVDPLAGQYPSLSAYGHAGGMAVTMTDLDGAEPIVPVAPGDVREIPLTLPPTVWRTAPLREPAGIYIHQWRPDGSSETARYTPGSRMEEIGGAHSNAMDEIYNTVVGNNMIENILKSGLRLDIHMFDDSAHIPLHLSLSATSQALGTHDNKDYTIAQSARIIVVGNQTEWTMGPDVLPEVTNDVVSIMVHEISHGHDYIMGGDYYRINNAILSDGTTLLSSEYRASTIENMFRLETGRPLRTHYSNPSRPPSIPLLFDNQIDPHQAGSDVLDMYMIMIDKINNNSMIIR